MHTNGHTNGGMHKSNGECASIKHTSQSINERTNERSNYNYRQHFSSLIKIIQYQRIGWLAALSAVLYYLFCVCLRLLMHLISFIQFNPPSAHNLPVLLLLPLPLNPFNMLMCTLHTADKNPVHTCVYKLI